MSQAQERQWPAIDRLPTRGPALKACCRALLRPVSAAGRLPGFLFVKKHAKERLYLVIAISGSVIQHPVCFRYPA